MKVRSQEKWKKGALWEQKERYRSSYGALQWVKTIDICTAVIVIVIGINYKMYCTSSCPGQYETQKRCIRKSDSYESASQIHGAFNSQHQHHQHQVAPSALSNRYHVHASEHYKLITI